MAVEKQIASWRRLMSVGMGLGLVSLAGVACGPGTTPDAGGDDAAMEAAVQPDVAPGEASVGSEASMMEETGAPDGGGMEASVGPEAGGMEAGGMEAGTVEAGAEAGMMSMAPFTVRVSAGAAPVANGSTQMPTQLNGVPGFSDGVTDYTIVNGAAATTISITLEPIMPTRNDEWTLNETGRTTRNPITVMNRTLMPMESFSFGLYFSPRASGQRDVRVKINYAGGEFAFVTQGRGRDNLVISPNATASLERLYGMRTQSSLAGTAVADTSGNLYFSQNVSQWSDNFSNNIALARMNADGTLAWAREWNEMFMQRQPDPGQNAESGGAPGSVAMGPDGSLFFVGNRSLASTNNTFQGLVARVDPANGNMLWARGVLRSAVPVPTLANQGVQAYAVDATLPDRVLVTGQAGDNDGIMLVALSKADGSLLYAFQLPFAPAGTVSRGHAITVDAEGNGYIGGFTGDASTAALVRLTGLNTTMPTVAWGKVINIGRGGNINHLVSDGMGGVVASLDFRGASTRFGAVRVNSTGMAVWGRVWDLENSTPNNNTYTVAVSGTSVYVGGRISIAPYDTTTGEGYVMRLGLADGAWQWGAFYYTGKTTTTISEHRVKAIIPTASGLLVMQQAFPGMNNESHYSGLWYQTTDEGTMFPSGTGSMRLVDGIAMSAISVMDHAAPTVNPLRFTQSATVSHPGTAHSIDTTMIWQMPPASVTFNTPAERMANNGRGMVMLQRIDVR